VLGCRAPGETHCAIRHPRHRALAAGRRVAAKTVCPLTTLPSTGHRGRLSERFPTGGLRWACPLFMVKPIFLLSWAKQAAAREESTEDSCTLRLDGSQSRNLEAGGVAIAISSCPSARGRPLSRRLRVCNSAEGCSLPSEPLSVSARRRATQKGNPSSRQPSSDRRARHRP